MFPRVRHLLLQHWSGLAQLPIILLAATLRLHQIEIAPISSDEASSWRVSQYPVFDAIRHCAANVHPPLYFLLLKGWLAVAGDSLAAMRSLSALLGTICVPVVYLLYLQAVRFGRAEEVTSTHLNRCGALFAGVIVAVQPLQVSIGRTARMYPLGVLLTGLSSWLLLRAMGSGRYAYRLWSAYAVAAVGLCYTHNYGAIAVACQLLFVAGVVLHSLGRGDRQRAGELTVSSGFAVGLLIAFYSPWLPSALRQVREVQTDYWIPAPTVQDLSATFAEWLGMSATIVPAGAVALIAVALVALPAILYIALRSPGATLLCTIALGAWLPQLVSSATGSPSVLQLRYLAFGQLPLAVLAGMALTCLPRLELRAAAAAVAPVGLIVAALTQIQTESQKFDPIQAAIVQLQSDYTAGDVVLVSFPGDVNMALYHARQHRIAALDVRCPVSPGAWHAHVPHLASLQATDTVAQTDVWASLPRGANVWQIAAHHRRDNKRSSERLLQRLTDPRELETAPNRLPSSTGEVGRTQHGSDT